MQDTSKTQLGPKPSRDWSRHRGYPRPLRDFLDDAAAEFDEFKRCPRWGRWSFIRSTLVLVNAARRDCVIELETSTSPEDVLDWLAHVRDVYSAEELGYLIIALDDLLGFRRHLLASRQLGSKDITNLRAQLTREGWLARPTRKRTGGRRAIPTRRRRSSAVTPPAHGAGVPE